MIVDEFERWWKSGGLVAAGAADLLKGSFDEVFALVTEAVVNGGHRLNRAGSRAGKGEFAVFDFALVQGEGPVAEHDKTAVGEFAGVVFVEIEDDFFVGELVVADFHMDFPWVGMRKSKRIGRDLATSLQARWRKS